jgi:anti-sigma factor RsiW
MATEQEVAGIRCGEVLAELSDFLDGELPPERRAQVVAHLQGCDVCERFGGAFTAAIHSLWQEGGNQPIVESVVYERLRVRLEQVAGRDTLRAIRETGSE